MSGSRRVVDRAVQPREIFGKSRGRTAQAERQAPDVRNAVLNDPGFRQRLEDVVLSEYRTAVRLAAKTYLSVPDLTDYLAFDSEAATWQWLHRHPEVRKHRAGRRVLVRRSQVDETIQPAVE